MTKGAMTAVIGAGGVAKESLIRTRKKLEGMVN